MGIVHKKKECLECKEMKLIFSHGRCRTCANKVAALVTKLKRKEKSETVSSLKKRLDAVFSIWIRNRGSKDGMNTCVCCGVVKPIKELQCAHYFSRRFLSLRYDEHNCHPNCVRCNVLLNGNYPAYADFMIGKYGKGELDKMNIQKDNTVKMTKEDYKILIRKYE